jgi:hypothetical protein
MDGRMEADDAYAIEKADQQQAAYEHASLVKNIAKSVLIELADQGMDVDGTDVKTVGGGDPTKGATATPNYVGDSDDSSETITPSTKIEDQQASIQAEDDDDDENGNEEDRFNKAMGFPKKEKAMHDDEEENGEDEEKAYMKKADDEEEDEDDVKKLQKQLLSLQKQISSLDISKAVKDESENRLRKMGFKEENGLQKPQLTNVFGADETPIRKAQNIGEVVDQLTNLSYKELRKMQEYKRRGLVEGLPDEIANL